MCFYKSDIELERRQVQGIVIPVRLGWLHQHIQTSTHPSFRTTDRRQGKVSNEVNRNVIYCIFYGNIKAYPYALYPRPHIYCFNKIYADRWCGMSHEKVKIRRYIILLSGMDVFKNLTLNFKEDEFKEMYYLNDSEGCINKTKRQPIHHLFIG